MAGSLSPAGAVLNLIARPRTRLNTYPTRFYGSLLFSRCFAVCFDRIVLASLSDRHAINGLAMLINYSYIPLRRGERVDGKLPVGKQDEGNAKAALANSSTTLTSPRKAKPRSRYNFPRLQAHICVDSTPAIS